MSGSPVSVLAFFELPNSPPMGHDEATPLWVQHIAFKVPDMDNLLGAKARAAIAGQYNVTCAHVRDVAPLVLRHRILTNFHAEAEGMHSDKIVGMLLKHVSEPRPEDYQ